MYKIPKGPDGENWCSICKENVDTRSMERHMSKKHGIETPDEAEKGPDETWCHICKKNLGEERDKKKHMLKKHGIETEKGPNEGSLNEDPSGSKTWCHLCEKNLSDERSKEKHMLKKHGIGPAGLTNSFVWRLDIGRVAVQ